MTSPSRAQRSIGPELETWAEARAGVPSGSILLGNGASRAVWNQFDYRSLYEEACRPAAIAPLSATDRSLFDSLQSTRNFEAVLAALATTRTVNQVLSIPTDSVANRYESIKAALIGAVHSVHVPWSRVAQAVLLKIREALLHYDSVYTTNYDLLLYWAMMAGDREGFKDFFWEQDFDITNATIWGNVTGVYYLHGALHLYKLPSGATRKDIAGSSNNLLDRFGALPHGIPLLISEGTTEDKLRSISRSSYLSFALDALSQDTGTMTVFGHSLSNQDAHLVRAIRGHKHRRLLIGIYPGDDNAIISDKAGLISRLPDCPIRFFDSRTHPLGAADLRIS